MGKGGRKKGSSRLPKVGSRTELQHESQREEASVLANFGIRRGGSGGSRRSQQPVWVKWVAMFVVVALVLAGIASLVVLAI
ncbi:MAG: hypothetical protein JWL73_3463 [Actinomycetia bacterium]|nr:hypothetical protein [Actinomycetes bacterium]